MNFLCFAFCRPQALTQFAFEWNVFQIAQAGVKYLTVQLEKEEFLQTLELSSSLDFRHESPLGADYQHGPNRHKHQLESRLQRSIYCPLSV